MAVSVHHLPLLAIPGEHSNYLRASQVCMKLRGKDVDPRFWQCLWEEQNQIPEGSDKDPEQRQHPPAYQNIGCFYMILSALYHKPGLFKSVLYGQKPRTLKPQPAARPQNMFREDDTPLLWSPWGSSKAEFSFSSASRPLKPFPCWQDRTFLLCGLPIN